MVYFICGACGDSFKRKQADLHRSRCRNWSFSCLDCQQGFEGDAYVQHSKCVSETEKYWGAHHVAKNKPDKNELWMQKVRHHLGSQQHVSPFIKRLLSRICAHPNVPRKVNPFTNFLQTNLNMRDPKTQAILWEMVSKAAEVNLDQLNGSDKKESNETTGLPDKKATQNGVEKSQSTNGKDTKEEVKSKKRKERAQKEESEESADEEKMLPESKSARRKKRKMMQSATEESIPGMDGCGAAQAEIATVEAVSKFKWRRTLKTLLKEAPADGMKLSKLLSRVERLHNDPVAGVTYQLPRDTLRSIMMKTLNKDPFRIQGNRAKRGAFAKTPDEDDDY